MTLSELAKKFELHPNQISLWTREFIDYSTLIFEAKKKIKNIVEIYNHHRDYQGIDRKKQE